MLYAIRCLFLAIAVPALLTAQHQTFKEQQHKTPLPPQAQFQERLDYGSADRATLNHAARITSVTKAVPVRVRETPVVASPQVSAPQAAQQHVPKYRAGMPIEAANVEFAPNGTARFVAGVLGTLNLGKYLGKLNTLHSPNAAAKAAQNGAAVREALALLETTKILPQLEKPSAELRLMSAEHDNIDFQHIRFEQTHNGLRVYGRDVYVHANAAGEVYCVNGQYEPTPRIATTPRITPEQATDAAVEALLRAGEGIPANAGETELLVYPMNGRVYLAYSVVTWGARPWKYFVDAYTGIVLNRVGASPMDGAPYWSARPQAASEDVPKASSKATPKALENVVVREVPLYEPSQPSRHLKPIGEILSAGGFLTVQGVDLIGEMRSVRAWRRTSDGRIFPVADGINNSRETPEDRMPLRPNGGHIVLDANNAPAENIDNLTIPFIMEGQTFSPAIISALWNTDSVARYFAAKLNRTSWDAQGTRMTTILNVGGSDRDAAWWSSNLAAQGYGPGVRSARSTVGDLWTIGHEVGHAVNSATARLEYNNGEQGSMEEHFANVWGWMTDRNTFWMARQAFGTDPTDGGRHFGARDSLRAGQPSRMSEFVRDARSPHANAGIPDRAAYLCILGLGRDTTEQLWFRALTAYTTQNSGFSDLRRGVVQAAQDLYANNTRVLAVINNAFDDAGIMLGAPTQRVSLLSGKIVDAPSTQDLRSTVALMTKSGRVGLYDVASKQALFFTGDAPNARPLSQLSAPRDGKRLYFVSRRGVLSFIELRTGSIGSFANLFIRQQGDIASAAIAPDEKTVALLSVYDNDPNVYIATIGTVSTQNPSTTTPGVRAIALKRDAATSADNGTRRAEGRQLSGIRYADALGWSPDATNPAFLVDALSTVKLGSDTLEYWSLLYSELNGAGAGRPAVYDLYPPEPDVNLGYPVYSSRNSGTVAFTEFAPDGKSDIYIADFDKATDRGFLGLSSFRIGASATAPSITSADQASFSPDDRQIAFIAPNIAANALFVYSFTTGTVRASVEAVIIDSTVTRPFWSQLEAVMTSIDDANTTANTNGVLSVSPNPSSEAASVQCSLEKAQEISLVLYSSLGQQIMTVFAGRKQAGEHSFHVDVSALPEGVYALRMHSGAVSEPSATRMLRVVR